MESDSSLRDQALAQLKRKREFRSHVVVYFAVNALLWLIWALSDDRGDTGGVPWPVFVTVFWGFGVAMQAFSIYGQRPISDQEIDQEVQRMKGGG